MEAFDSPIFWLLAITGVLLTGVLGIFPSKVT